MFRGGTVSIVLDLQALEVPAEEAALPSSTISNSC
ncbi:MULTISPECIES: class III lanthipeptide [Streptomyces]|nr:MULTISPECIES: class III lanthipeptide [Streptomyces]MCC3651639.1 class III lanthipeptide [Streptomyces sp. S07_1.15]MCC5035591.1 class III lanthipeptide [Streptomyces sp. WAC 00631]MCC9739356.1 class III lanthipeptide [Streptomyces sp. MNU89]WSQ73586.1 class III lanthipeptide [Streptomyces xinghaiensis]